MARKDNPEGSALRVDAVEDLRSLKNEFKSQMARREELEKRLTNVQILVRQVPAAW
jgi:hypothetical protein